jgi:hypothetical protein
MSEVGGELNVVSPPRTAGTDIGFGQAGRPALTILRGPWDGQLASDLKEIGSRTGRSGDRVRCHQPRC